MCGKKSVIVGAGVRIGRGTAGGTCDWPVLYREDVVSEASSDMLGIVVLGCLDLPES